MLWSAAEPQERLSVLQAPRSAQPGIYLGSNDKSADFGLPPRSRHCISLHEVERLSSHVQFRFAMRMHHASYWHETLFTMAILYFSLSGTLCCVLCCSNCDPPVEPASLLWHTKPTLRIDAFRRWTRSLSSRIYSRSISDLLGIQLSQTRTHPQSFSLHL